MINEHLASCYSWGTTSRNIANSVLRQVGASLWRYIWGWRVSVSPTSTYCSIGEWVYYNSADESFLSTKFCSRLHSIEVDFYSKMKSSLFEPPFGRLRGNVRTSSIARWKARVRLPIRHNWTFFASSYCWDVTGKNLSTWAIFEGRWVTLIAH